MNYNYYIYFFFMMFIFTTKRERNLIFLYIRSFNFWKNSSIILDSHEKFVWSIKIIFILIKRLNLKNKMQIKNWGYCFFYLHLTWDVLVFVFISE